MLLIAEVKTASPFGFRSTRTWSELFSIAEKHGDWVAIHTDPRWGGSFELLATARKLTDKPILAKGVHASDEDIDRAIECGANWVLAVGRVPSVHAGKCIIEPNTLDDLRRLPAHARVVWNGRDLKTGGRRPETFWQARQAFDGWLCKASFIHTLKDVDHNADAILVGEKLPEFTARF